MLQRNSTKVATCLASAARSYERALEARDPEMREFFQQMEGSWMRLGASIAFSERVELFLQNWRHDADGERCLRCRGPMQLKLIEAREGGETITFECLNCGLDHVHDASLESAT
jgi:hypothetical protein